MTAPDGLRWRSPEVDRLLTLLHRAPIKPLYSGKESDLPHWISICHTTEVPGASCAGGAHGRFRTAVHVLMNQKGGVGKSTLAMNLAAVKADVQTASPSGISPVLAVSIDPQGSGV